MLKQRTICRKISVTGIGLHSGKKVKLTLSPAPADHGIWFKRTDNSRAKALKACVENIGATENATTLGEGDSAIHTVEHLLAVLYGLGIDNINCELDGSEVPIMDGSGASFVFLLKEVGVRCLPKLKNFMVVLKEIKVNDGDKWAVLRPSSRLVINSTINFSHPMVKTQKESFEFSCENFVREISRARTFGMLKDVDYLKKKGLIRGGSLDNAVVLDDYKVVNPDGLRFENEFVRHKILDTLGDLSLLGHELAAEVETYKSGHQLHKLLCEKLLNTPDSYEIVNAGGLEIEAIKSFDISQLVVESVS